MACEQEKDIVIRFWEAFEVDDRDALNEILAPDFVAHAAGAPGPHGRDEHLQAVAMFNTAFSDRLFTVDEMITERDMVVTRTTMRGTHTGELQGHPPTGKQISTTGLTMERLEDGKIVERWIHFDVAGVLQELGIETEAPVHS